MAKDFTKILAKLDRPPSGHNWVRFVHETRPIMTRSILSFANGQPRFTYQPASTAIRDRIQLGIALEAAVLVTQRFGAPAGRLQNEELVRAFFEYDRSRRYAAANCIEFEKEWFRVSRDVSVPVAPLVVIRERGNFVPLFFCGWSELALTLSQRRLLMTIYE